MNVAHLDHLNMTVADLSASIDWYDRLLGFKVQESGVYEGHPWAILKSGEAMLCIYEYEGFELAMKDVQHAAHRHGISHFALRITDHETWERTLESEQPKLLYGGVVDWPHSKSWYVQDPTGYEIEVALWDDDQVRFG
jgi:catechol 2,3-dioxygenase-like lactoylglutathione lyase family enzyme